MSPKREKQIKLRLSQLDEILMEWEEQRDLTSDPTYRMRANTEINRTKDTIAGYLTELANGPRMVEDDNPVTSPNLKDINRQWIIRIILGLVMVIMSYTLYQQFTKVNPDYNAYRAFVEQGDGAVLSRDYEQAIWSYEKALAYFPGDSAVQAKLDLMYEANRLIEIKNYGEAALAFELVLEIPISSEAKFWAEVGQKITLKVAFENGVLLIRITGGVPFNDPNQPYQLEGVDTCRGCISWAWEEGTWVASVKNPVEKVTLTIQVTDSNGQTASTDYQFSSHSNDPHSTPEDDDQADTTNQESPLPIDPEEFKLYAPTVERADELFESGNFIDALEKYQEAKKYTNVDDEIAHCDTRIGECKDELSKESETKVKRNILNKLVNISAGSFSMGDSEGFPGVEEPHQVSLGRFSLSTTEVTVGEYREFCKFTGSNMPEQPIWSSDNHPVVNISWQDANNFCKWVGARLPTEAEWEYAARASQSSKYSGGNVLGEISFYKNNSGDRSHTVAQKGRNSWGIYDMTGNVFEWCQDWYGEDYYTQSANSTNPAGPSSGTNKVIRGGSFKSVPAQADDQLRCTYRNYVSPGTIRNDIGFRIAR